MIFNFLFNRMANKDRSGDTLLRLSSNAPNYTTAVEVRLLNFAYYYMNYCVEK